MEKWIVRLEAEERSRLEHLVRTGKAAAYKIRHANVLLAVDESDAGPGLPDAQVAGVLGVAVRSIESLRRRLVKDGMDAAIGRKKRERPSIDWSARYASRSPRGLAKRSGAITNTFATARPTCSSWSNRFAAGGM